MLRIAGRDSEYFSVGKMSGELFLKRTFDSERDDYMIRVFAEDKIGQNAFAVVMCCKNFQNHLVLLFSLIVF